MSAATLMEDAEIELVDNWHPSWADVIRLVRRTGGICGLHLDEKDWLSARHNLLVAFVGRTPVAYLSLQVCPAAAPDGHVAFVHGRPATEARIDCRGRDPSADPGIEQQLLGHAVRRTQELHCRGLLDEQGGTVTSLSDGGPASSAHDYSN